MSKIALLAGMALTSPAAGFQAKSLPLLRQMNSLPLARQCPTPVGVGANGVARLNMISVAKVGNRGAGTRDNAGGPITRLRSAVLGICAAVRLDACM